MSSQVLLGHPALLVVLLLAFVAGWLITREDNRRYFGYGLASVLVALVLFLAVLAPQRGAVGEHGGTTSTIRVTPPPSGEGS